MPRGYAPSRVDGNQKLMVELFRKMGASVLQLHSVGKGCPDLLISYNTHNVLIELKDGSKCPSQRQLTELERDFFNSWNGQVCLISTEEEAMSLICHMRKWNAFESMLQNGCGC